jgi:chorismate-pyruvate lyase
MGLSPFNSDADLYTRSVVRLTSLFFDGLDELGRFEPVTADELPDDYRALLAHHDHMTVTLEAYHRSLVDVRALAEWRDEASYARNSLLTRQRDGAILQFGIMRIWLADLPPAARDEITVQRLPLGRVLIAHDVLREVELISLWRIEPGPVVRKQMRLNDDRPIYGRSAQILLNERPTVQMLEIVAVDPAGKD